MDEFRAGFIVELFGATFIGSVTLLTAVNSPVSSSNLAVGRTVGAAWQAHFHLLGIRNGIDDFEDDIAGRLIRRRGNEHGLVGRPGRRARLGRRQRRPRRLRRALVGHRPRVRLRRQLTAKRHRPCCWQTSSGRNRKASRRTAGCGQPIKSVDHRGPPRLRLTNSGA